MNNARFITVFSYFFQMEMDILYSLFTDVQSQAVENESIIFIFVIIT